MSETEVEWGLAADRSELYTYKSSGDGIGTSEETKRKEVRMKLKKKKMRVEDECDAEMGKKKKKKRVEEMGNNGYLPCDVLCDVLSRLPVKILSKFKCVCKGWHSLIKDDTFVQLQLSRSMDNGTGRLLRVCFRRYDDFFVPKARFYKEEDDVRTSVGVRVGKIVPFRFPSLPPSCNGLVCYMSRDNGIQVCNPITHQTITLPKPFFLVQKRLTNLEDPNLTVKLGIGYVSVEKKYKVLVAWSTRIDSGVEIFTLGTKSRRKLTQLSSKHYGSLLTDPFSRFSAPAYADGALYWYLTEDSVDDDGEHSRRYSPDIISFNFTEEKFNLIPVPQDVDLYNHVCWIFELQGHLCLLERAEYVPVHKMWMLRNHEWVTQTIPPNLIWVGTISTNQNGYMSIVTQGNDTQEALHSHLYNYKGQLIKPTKVSPSLSLRKYYFEVGQFHQESLVSLTSHKYLKVKYSKMGRAEVKYWIPTTEIQWATLAMEGLRLYTSSSVL